jgi:hypothetical protein
MHIGQAIVTSPVSASGLADFAKLVELFDTHGVSFVSVTQQRTRCPIYQLSLPRCPAIRRALFWRGAPEATALGIAFE